MRKVSSKDEKKGTKRPPLLTDITQVPDEQFIGHKKVGPLEIVQKDIFTRNLESIASSLVSLMKANQVQIAHELFSSLVYYMLLQGETSNVQRVIEILLTIEDYCEDVMNAAQQLKQQGEQLGEYRKAVAVAKKMLAKRLDLEFIKEMTGLSDKDLLSLED